MPPLDYPLVCRLKRERPELTIVINGGIGSLDEAEAHLDHVDGVMLGRAAYHTPALLGEVDARLFGEGEVGHAGRGGRALPALHRARAGQGHASGGHDPAHAGPVPRRAGRADLAAHPDGRGREAGRGPGGDRRAPWRRCQGVQDRAPGASPRSGRGGLGSSSPAARCRGPSRSPGRRRCQPGAGHGDAGELDGGRAGLAAGGDHAVAVVQVGGRRSPGAGRRRGSGPRRSRRCRPGSGRSAPLTSPSAQIVAVGGLGDGGAGRGGGLRRRSGDPGLGVGGAQRRRAAARAPRRRSALASAETAATAATIVNFRRFDTLHHLATSL